jgi:4-oxalocrotonate tautomerase
MHALRVSSFQLPQGASHAITVKVIENVFTPEEKSEMIRRITDTLAEIEGESMRPNTWVVVEEVRSGDWGIAGKGLTTADVRAVRGLVPAVV